MNAVIEQIQREDAASLDSDQARYAELVIKGDRASGDEVRELRMLLERLRKTAADLQADHNIIQRAVEFEGIIQDGTGLDEQIQAAEKAKHDFHLESERIKAERLAEAKRLSNVSSNLQSRSFAAREHREHLKKLVNLHPDILKHRHPKLVVSATLDPNRPVPGGVVSDLRL